jgi:hypothetical protein
MSALLMGRAFYVPLDSTSLLVLLALADHANDQGAGARPGLARLGAKARLSRRGVQDCLKHLESHGLIAASGYRRGGRGHATNWVLDVVTIRLWSDLYEDDPDEWQRVQEAHRIGIKGAACDRKGCSLAQETVRPGVPQPSGTIKNRAEDDSNPIPRGGIVAEFHRRINGGDS